MSAKGMAPEHPIALGARDEFGLDMVSPIIIKILFQNSGRRMRCAEVNDELNQAFCKAKRSNGNSAPHFDHGARITQPNAKLAGRNGLI